MLLTAVTTEALNILNNEYHLARSRSTFDVGTQSSWPPIKVQGFANHKSLLTSIVPIRIALEPMMVLTFDFHPFYLCLQCVLQQSFDVFKFPKAFGIHFVLSNHFLRKEHP